MAVPEVFNAADEMALSRLAHLYARACDRNEPHLLADLFTADGVLETPDHRADTADRIRKIPGFLARTFALTRHLVMNQTVSVLGDEAEGETYGSASHVTLAADGGAESWVWSIRYQDRFRRCADGWRFSRRELIVDWTERRRIEPGADLAAMAAARGRRP